MWSQWPNGTPDEAKALVMPIEAEKLWIVKEGLDKIDSGGSP